MILAVRRPRREEEESFREQSFRISEAGVSAKKQSTALSLSLTPDQFIERLYNLRVDTTTRDGDGSPHEKPHKPLLLLAALDLIDEGLATPDRIPWNQDLRDRFKFRFEIYDHQCAACGLGIRLPDGNIIAPGPDFHWHISKLIDPRRSNGEKELAHLAGQSVLLPKDPAFHPDEKGLRWREEKLSA